MKYSRGYIAIVSVIIVSAILMLYVFTDSTNIFWARYGQLTLQSKAINQSLSYSCAYEALLESAEDSNFSITSTTKQQISIDSEHTCVIDSLSSSARTNPSLTTHANSNNVYAGLSVLAAFRSGILSVTSWRDITSIPP